MNTTEVFQPLSADELDKMHDQIHELVKYKIEKGSHTDTYILLAASSILHEMYMRERFIG